jgi:hypothetical protein
MIGKNKIIRYLLISTCLISSGCTTLSGVTGVIIAPPKNPPNIIYGQKALIKGYIGDLESWQPTGLFSSIEYTSSRNPPSQGVFVINECNSEGIEEGFFRRAQNPSATYLGDNVAWGKFIRS